MVKSIVRYKNGEENSITEIFENMHGYISLLRNHIAKENNILFRMADKVLSENDHQILLKEFTEVETNKRPVTDYIKAIEKLEEKYKQ